MPTGKGKMQAKITAVIKEAERVHLDIQASPGLARMNERLIIANTFGVEGDGPAPPALGGATAVFGKQRVSAWQDLENIPFDESEAAWNDAWKALLKESERVRKMFGKQESSIQELVEQLNKSKLEPDSKGTREKLNDLSETIENTKTIKDYAWALDQLRGDLYAEEGLQHDEWTKANPIEKLISDPANGLTSVERAFGNSEVAERSIRSIMSGLYSTAIKGLLDLDPPDDQEELTRSQDDGENSLLFDLSDETPGDDTGSEDDETLSGDDLVAPGFSPGVPSPTRGPGCSTCHADDNTKKHGHEEPSKRVSHDGDSESESTDSDASDTSYASGSDAPEKKRWEVRANALSRLVRKLGYERYVATSGKRAVATHFAVEPLNEGEHGLSIDKILKKGKKNNHEIDFEYAIDGKDDKQDSSWQPLSHWGLELNYRREEKSLSAQPEHKQQDSGWSKWEFTPIGGSADRFVNRFSKETRLFLVGSDKQTDDIPLKPRFTSRPLVGTLHKSMETLRGGLFKAFDQADATLKKTVDGFARGEERFREPALDRAVQASKTCTALSALNQALETETEKTWTQVLDRWKVGVDDTQRTLDAVCGQEGEFDDTNQKYLKRWFELAKRSTNPDTYKDDSMASLRFDIYSRKGVHQRQDVFHEYEVGQRKATNKMDKHLKNLKSERENFTKLIGEYGITKVPETMEDMIRALRDRAERAKEQEAAEVEQGGPAETESTTEQAEQGGTEAIAAQETYTSHSTGGDGAHNSTTSGQNENQGKKGEKKQKRRKAKGKGKASNARKMWTGPTMASRASKPYSSTNQDHKPYSSTNQDHPATTVTVTVPHILPPEKSKVSAIIPAASLDPTSLSGRPFHNGSHSLSPPPFRSSTIGTKSSLNPLVPPTVSQTIPLNPCFKNPKSENASGASTVDTVPDKTNRFPAEPPPVTQGSRPDLPRQELLQASVPVNSSSLHPQVSDHSPNKKDDKINVADSASSTGPMDEDASTSRCGDETGLFGDYPPSSTPKVRLPEFPKPPAQDIIRSAQAVSDGLKKVLGVELPFYLRPNIRSGGKSLLRPTRHLGPGHMFFKQNRQSSHSAGSFQGRRPSPMQSSTIPAIPPYQWPLSDMPAPVTVLDHTNYGTTMAGDLFSSHGPSVGGGPYAPPPSHPSLLAYNPVPMTYVNWCPTQPTMYMYDQFPTSSMPPVYSDHSSYYNQYDPHIPRQSPVPVAPQFADYTRQIPTDGTHSYPHPVQDVIPEGANRYGLAGASTQSIHSELHPDHGVLPETDKSDEETNQARSQLDEDDDPMGQEDLPIPESYEDLRNRQLLKSRFSTPLSSHFSRRSSF